MPWTRAGSRSGGGQQAGKCRLRPASRRARSPPRGWAGEPTGLTGSPLVGVPLSTGGCTPIFSVVSGCGHPLRVPPLAVEQEKDKGSDGSTLEPGGKPLHPQPPVAVSTSWRRPSSQNSFFLHCDPSSRNAFPPWKGILFSSVFNLFYFLLGLHSQLVHSTVIFSPPPPFYCILFSFAL